MLKRLLQDLAPRSPDPGRQPHHQGGNFTLNLNGPNARVSINSTDNSTNVVGKDEA